MHRFQISIFGSIAIVFAVMGVNQGIFSRAPALNAMSAGWLILAMVDILWVLYFTSEEDSLSLHIFNSMGTGGLTPPSRRRRTRTQTSVHNMASNGYATNYSSGGGIGPHDVPYDSKMAAGVGSGGLVGGGAIRSQNSFGGGSQHEGAANRSIGGGTGGGGSLYNAPTGGPGSTGGGDTNGPSSPLMAGVGAGALVGGPGSTTATDTNPGPESYSYKAKALYACEFLHSNPSLILTNFSHPIPPRYCFT